MPAKWLMAWERCKFENMVCGVRYGDTIGVYMIVPQIIEANSRKLVGIRRQMSLAENSTAELWREFHTGLDVVPNRIGGHWLSLQKYPQGYFSNFDPRNQFEKWATVEVTNHDRVPASMEALILDAGLFAVFHYVGSSAEGRRVFQFIYGEWLPKSDFLLDERPHFELLGQKYKNNDPSSEEDIWIPIKTKSWPI
jgi:AraC family transcriptional regulator